MSDVTMEQRLGALENQAYIMYLQLNGLTKIVLEKEIMTQDELTAEMDELNKQIQNMTEEMAEGEADPEAIQTAESATETAE